MRYILRAGWSSVVSIILAIVGFVGLGRGLTVVVWFMHEVAIAHEYDFIARATAHYEWIMRQALVNNGAALSVSDSLFYFVVPGVCVVLPCVWVLRRSPSYRYRLVLRIIASINQCASTLRERATERPAALCVLDRRCRKVERLLFRVHRTSRSIPSRSPRRPHVKRHAAHVAGALREQLNRVDTDPDQGLRDLALLLTRIGDNYAAGRPGALLCEEALADVRPVSRFLSAWRESAHMALMILAAMGAAIGASVILPALGIGDEIRPGLIAGCALIAALAVAGWRRVSAILAAIPG